MQAKDLLLAAGLAALWAAAALATALVTTEAHAARAPRVERDFVAARGPLAVEVKVSGGSTPLFMASNRPDRWYLEARQGQKYEIKVRNTTGERVGFVLAVDGLNAINGRISRNASDEAMYVLDPWASSTIKGWRKNLDNVSRFVFVDERRSYAERTGQGNGDLGWIRVTAFNEVWYGWGREIKDQVRRSGGERGNRDEWKANESEESAPPSAQAPESRSRASNGMGAQGSGGDIAPAPSREPIAESNPGTGWGPNQRDRVREVDFQPRPIPAAQVVLRYEYRPALVALGILPWHDRNRDRTWERDHGMYGFAQPPRGDR